MNIKKFIPSHYYDTVFDVDYKKLYSDGKRYILTDLDNTLISYSLGNSTEKLIELFLDLEKIGFKLVIVSNSRNKRVQIFAKELKCLHIASAKKPLKQGIRKALSLLNRPNNGEVIFIGDQLLTDVLAANSMKIDSILVETLESKAEKWYTRFNRKLEIIMVKKIKKKYPKEYERVLSEKYGK